jgi:hypothetical protein
MSALVQKPPLALVLAPLSGSDFPDKAGVAFPQIVVAKTEPGSLRFDSLNLGLRF